MFYLIPADLLTPTTCHCPDCGALEPRDCECPAPLHPDEAREPMDCDADYESLDLDYAGHETQVLVG